MSTGLFDDIEDEPGTGLFDDIEDEPGTGLFDDIEDEPLIQPVPYTRPPNEATHPANIPDLTGMPVSPEAVAAATRAASMGISLNLAKSPLFSWYNQTPSEQDVRNAYTNAQKRIETPDKTIKQPARTLGMDDYPADTTVPVYTPEQKVDNFVSANVLQQAVEQGTSPEGLSPADLGLHRESLLAKAGLSPATSSILWYDPATGKTEQRFVNPEQVPGSPEWRAADSARWPGSDRWRDTYNADGTFTPGAWSNIGNAVVKRAIWDPDNQHNRLRLGVTGENWARQAVETVAAVPGMFLHGMLLASDLAAVGIGTATGAQGVVDENTRDFKDRLVSAGGAGLDMIKTTSQRLEYPEHFVHEYPMDAVGLMTLPGIGVKIASGMAGRVAKEGSKAQKFFLSTAKAADYAVNLTDPFNLIVKGHGLARELTKGKAKTTITANQPVDVKDPSYIQPGEYTDSYHRLNAFASPENYYNTRIVWADGSSATLHSTMQKLDTQLAGVVQDAVDHGKAIPKEFAPTLDDFLRTEGDRAMLVTEAADMPGAPLGREGGGVWDAEVTDTVAKVKAVSDKQGTGILNTPKDVEQHILRNPSTVSTKERDLLVRLRHAPKTSAQQLEAWISKAAVDPELKKRLVDELQAKSAAEAQAVSDVVDEARKLSGNAKQPFTLENEVALRVKARVDNKVPEAQAEVKRLQKEVEDASSFNVKSATPADRIAKKELVKSAQAALNAARTAEKAAKDAAEASVQSTKQALQDLREKYTKARGTAATNMRTWLDGDWKEKVVKGELNTVPATRNVPTAVKLTPEQAIREAELRPKSLTHYAHAYTQGLRPDAIPLDHLDRANMYAELSSMSTEQRQNRAIRLEPHPSDPTQGPIQFAGDELLALLTPAERSYLQWVHDRFSGNITRLKGATIAYRADDGTLIQAVPGDPVSNYPVGVQPGTGFDIGVSAAATRTSIFRQGAESVERGLLAKETFLNTADDYLADIYPRAPEVVAPMFGKNTVGIQGDRYRKAKNKHLPLAERRARGMAANARLTSAITLAEVGSDLRTAELLDKLHVAKLPDGRPFAAAIPQGPKHLYPKLPEGKRYGKLSGKHVPADAHKWLTRMNEPLAHQTYLKYLGMYKEGATVWRPAGQVRNYVSEFVKATMNGTLSPTGLRVLDGLAKEVWNKSGPRYTEGVRNGLISHRSSLTEYSATEHSEIADMVDAGVISAAKGNPLAAPSKVMEVMEKVWAKTGGAYGKAARKTWGFSDDLFKHWRFQFIAELQRQFKKSGGKLTSEMIRAFDSVDEAIQVLSGDMSWAAKDAQKWHFDYADIPVAVEWAKKWYAPFMTYQFKALPLMSKWMTNHPLEAFAWRNAFNTVNTVAEAYATGGLTEEETLNRMWAMEDLSAYDKHAAVMFGSTMTPKMGDDEEGQESYVTSNVANYTPLGQPVNVDLPNYTSVIPGLPNASNPILTAAAAMFNRDPRSPARGDLSNRAGGSERSVLVGDIVDAVGSSWIPGWRETKKLYAAINEEPLSRRPYNVVKSVPETLAEVLGGVRMNYIPKDQAGNAMRRRFEDAERNILAELRKELAEKPRAKHEELKADATRRINELRAGLMQLNNDLERRARARTL